MSVWQFMAAVDGWIKANTSEDKKALSKNEVNDVWQYLQAKDTIQ
jgi:hypothetical protein